MQRSAELFNDSIHGSIEFNSLEMEIIDSPEFFRLKDIKQLGTWSSRGGWNSFLIHMIMSHCHRALSGAKLTFADQLYCTADGEQYQCCFALCTSVEHQCICYARQYFKKCCCSNSRKSMSGMAGYGVLHGPILLEEQESRSVGQRLIISISYEGRSQQAGG